MRRLACLLLLSGGARGDGPPEPALGKDTEALLAELDAEVAARREGGRGDDADALAAEVLALRRRAAEGGPPAPSASPEAHVVWVEWPGHRAFVRVTASGRPIVLVLGSRAPMRWDVEILKGVDVRRICTWGSDQQTVVSVPAMRADQLGEAEGSRPDEPMDALLGRQVEKKAGCSVRTCTAAAPDAPWPLVVGPENPAWQEQHVHADALDLCWRATRARRAAERETLKALRFGALYHWKTGDTMHVSFGDWTPLGPLLARHDPLPDLLAVATAAAKDDDSGEVYLLRHGVLIRYALPSGPPEVLRVPDTLPQVREPCALAVDTRRHRLLLATKHDHGYLYALDLKSREWSVLNDLDDVRAAGMAYDAQRDAILCLEYGDDGALRLQRFSPEDGQHQREVPVRMPPFGEKRALSATCVGGRLLLLYPPALPQRDAEESRAFVIEPHSGEVAFSTRVRPWEDFAPLGTIQFERLWNDLAAPDDAEATKAMRALAGQGDRAVEFLAKRFSPEPGVAEDLGRWIDRLADDDALVRDLAQFRLFEAGLKAEAFLSELNEDDLPPEARRRIAAVLKAVGGKSRLQRALRAIRVLEWIESPAAEALLRALSRRGDTERANAASEALHRLGRPRR